MVATPLAPSLPRPPVPGDRLTFDNFLTWNDGTERSFELKDGIPMPLSEPNAKHEDVVDGLGRHLSDYCQAQSLPYILRQGKQIRLPPNPEGYESSRKADLVLFTREEWERMRQTTASAAAYIAPPLVIEVVSTNWRDDYRIKLNEYEMLGILEYWIVDYAGLGATEYVGLPKQPTVTINCLVDGEYRATRFQGEAQIRSLLLPDLDLTVAQIVAMTTT